MSVMWLLYNSLAIIILILLIGVSFMVLQQYRWLWDIIVVVATAVGCAFVWQHGYNSLAAMHDLFVKCPLAFIYGSLYIISVVALCVFRDFRKNDRETYLSNELRQEYIYKNHETLTKEIAAFRTLITTLASGSFVALRALNATTAIKQDLSSAWLFCLISVVSVLLSHGISLLSIYVTLKRLANYDIKNDEVREFSNYLEYVFLFVAVVTLIIGYCMFSSCYVK